MTANHRPLLLLLAIAVFGAACQSTETAETGTITIQIDLDQQTPAKVTIDEVVFLESNNHSIFGKSQRIQFFDGRIYVLSADDTEALLLFNRQGDFLKKLPQGKGPGEVAELQDFTIDQAYKKVYVWDQATHRLSEFDADLNFQTASIIDHLLLMQFERMADRTWLVCRQERILADGQDYAFYHYSENFDSILRSIIPIPSDMTSYSLANPISREKDQQALFTNQYERDLYTVQLDSALIRYALDFSQYNIQESDFSTEKGYYQPFLLSREGKRVVSIDQLTNTNKYLAFSFYFKSQPHYFIYDKNAGTYWLSHHLTEAGMLPEGKLMGIAGGSFILACTPDQLLSFCGSGNGRTWEFCWNIKPDQNEALLLFTVSGR